MRLFGMGPIELVVCGVLLIFVVAAVVVVVVVVAGGKKKQSETPESGGPGAQGGWFADPTGRHESRYWDGSRWTQNVSDNGVQAQDPV